MKKGLYLECFSGLDGEMLVASLLDLGIDENSLKSAIDSTGLKGFDVEVGRNNNNGYNSCYFKITKGTMETIGSGESEYNLIKDVYRIISSANISDKAKDTSISAVNIILMAGAKVRGVNFNELKIDNVLSIEDILIIIAAAFCVDQLNVEDIIISEVYEGTGTVKDKYGVSPIPSPLVANILSDSSLILKFVDSGEEMLKASGIALASIIGTSQVMPEKFRVKRIGVGSNTLARSNSMRAFLIEEDLSQIKNETWILETNIDDTTGESLAFTMEKLLESGARDVFFTPIFMKKNRPAYKLSVTCRGDYVKKMESIIFLNTTTIGIKKYKIEKTVLDYMIINVDTIFGSVRVKVCTYNDTKYYSPEFEDIKSICNTTQKGYKEISAEVDMAILEFKR